MLKNTKQFIKGFKEGYEGNYIKVREVSEKKDDGTVAEILTQFEEEVPARDVLEIYEDFEHWLLITRPKDGGINLQPNFVLSKYDRKLNSVAFSKEELEYGMRKKPIYKIESEKGESENTIYECFMIASYEEDLVKICDTVMRVDYKIPIIGDRDRDEIGTRYSGEILKGDISKNDILEMIADDLQKERTVNVDFVEIRNMKSAKTAVFFSFENHQDDTIPLYFVKVADSKRKEYDDLFATIQKEIES